MPTPTVPVNNVQERIERSLFEAIRLKLVVHGYIPDITTFTNDIAGDANYKAAMNSITGGPIEVFENGSPLSKGIEAVPRIVCVTRRIMPGDIGKIDYEYRLNPLDPDAVLQSKPPYESSNIHIDIEVVSTTAKFDRILHAILAEAIGGTVGFIDVYDSTTKERFFIRQFNFYDVPDVENGIIKKVYSYDIPDMYLTDGMTMPNYPLIKEITAQVFAVNKATTITTDGTIIRPYQQDGKLFIDLSGVHFQGN